MKNIEQERENPSLSQDQMLQNLVRGQKEELGILKGETTGLNLNSWKSLRDWYKQTEGFRRAYSKAMRYNLGAYTQGGLNGLKDRFAGRMFQDIAFTSCALRQPDDCILLSPSKTLEFWRKLYPHPENPVIKNPFGLDSIGGISVPDSLLIVKNPKGVNQISAPYDYTLTGDVSYFKRHTAGFMMNKRHSPEVFSPNAYHLFIVPKGWWPKKQYGDLLFEQMPFTHEQFRDFTDSTHHFYRSIGRSIGSAATLLEAQKEANQQLDRSRKQVSSGKITPEHTLYLLNSIKNGKQFDETVALLSGL